jgi:ubiquinone/menaquinone biosynthesis C-methylase UbiE
VRQHSATEALDVDQADQGLGEKQAWIDAILARIAPHLPRASGLAILDIGAAQGGMVFALQQRGHHAVGVEPWREAIATAQELARRHGTAIEIHEGTAEDLPFPDEQFDVVLATSVMEHVGNLRQALREVYRVLRPGGIFWFNSASSMSPRQDEISRFPLFGWYPLPLKRRIMWWATRRKPHLVGHTQTPAINWFTPWSARRELHRAGFTKVWDRWELRQLDETKGLRRAVALVGKRIWLARIVGDLIVPGCSFATRKPG